MYISLFPVFSIHEIEINLVVWNPLKVFIWFYIKFYYTMLLTSLIIPIYSESEGTMLLHKL